MCGEKARVAHLVDTLPGSPPRVRGKVRHPQYTTSRGGITPACAGKSLSTRWTSLPYRDHPRVCGEKLAFSAFSARELGSPPRVRGKVLHSRFCYTLRRITPACAGKRSQGVAALQLGWDHPRVCGEKHLPAAAMQGCPGITPACAGKRDIPPQGSTAPGDHPRVCGEKPELPPAVQRHVGSPPRMRGKE